MPFRLVSHLPQLIIKITTYWRFIFDNLIWFQVKYWRSIFSFLTISFSCIHITKGLDISKGTPGATILCNFWMVSRVVEYKKKSYLWWTCLRKICGYLLPENFCLSFWGLVYFFNGHYHIAFYIIVWYVDPHVFV